MSHHWIAIRHNLDNAWWGLGCAGALGQALRPWCLHLGVTCSAAVLGLIHSHYRTHFSLRNAFAMSSCSSSNCWRLAYRHDGQNPPFVPSGHGLVLSHARIIASLNVIISSTYFLGLDCLVSCLLHSPQLLTAQWVSMPRTRSIFPPPGFHLLP